ncbi:hypothetical protein [Rhodococcus sp. WAY2]|nr:hypothetical protein [Rhodococcus sp. WAY2]QHE74238.1 hypothetical protein GFS60_07934 [Rhodococcus sp. WAY2]
MGTSPARILPRATREEHIARLMREAFHSVGRSDVVLTVRAVLA